MENKPEDIADIPRTWRPAWRPQAQAAPNCAHVLSRESWDRAWYLKVGIYKICISNIYIYVYIYIVICKLCEPSAGWRQNHCCFKINMTIESNWINAFPDSVPTFCLKECQSEDEDTKHETAVLQLPNPNSICHQWCNRSEAIFIPLQIGKNSDLLVLKPLHKHIVSAISPIGSHSFFVFLPIWFFQHPATIGRRHFLAQSPSSFETAERAWRTGSESSFWKSCCFNRKEGKEQGYKTRAGRICKVICHQIFRLIRGHRHTSHGRNTVLKFPIQKMPKEFSNRFWEW